MFGDTLTLSLYGGTDDAVFTRISSPSQDSGYAGVFRLATATHEARLTIRHSKTKAGNGKPSYDRHNIEIFDRVFATATTEEFTRKCYLVAEGLTSDAFLHNFIVGACSWLLASNASAAVKLRNWES